MHSVDMNTGEVLELEALDELREDSEDVPRLLLLTNASYPTDIDVISRISEIIARKLEQAERIRAQAERMAAPKLAAAKWLQEQITPHLRVLAESILPRYQSGEKTGQLKSKTLHLPSMSWSFRVGGGPKIMDKKAALEWCRDYAENCIKIVEEIDECMLINELIEEDAKLSFFDNTEIDEFATVKPSLPEKK